MNLRITTLLIVFLSFMGNLTQAASIKFINNYLSNSDHWSVVKSKSVYDSIKIQLKKVVSPNNVDPLKQYIIALKFREQLQASDEHQLPAYPTSAGIYNGSHASDSLSADDQLLLLYRNLGDFKSEAAILSSLGTKAAIKGDMDKAVSFLQNALKINTETNDRQARAKNCLSLARIYKYRGNLVEAVKYNQKIIELSLQNGSNHNLAEAYINLANLWSAQTRYKEAETLLISKALPLSYYKLKDMISTISCYDQLAEIYQKQKRFSESKWFYIQSNMLSRKINNPSGIVNSLINLAHVKMSIGDLQLALRDFREAEQLSITNKYIFKLVEIKNDLSKVYKAMGNTRASNSALTEFNVLKDALLSSIR